MNSLAILERTPMDRLAQLGVITKDESEATGEQPVTPTAWDNRGTWDNWSRR